MGKEGSVDQTKSIMDRIYRSHTGGRFYLKHTNIALRTRNSASHVETVSIGNTRSKLHSKQVPGHSIEQLAVDSCDERLEVFSSPEPRPHWNHCTLRLGLPDQAESGRLCFGYSRQLCCAQQKHWSWTSCSHMIYEQASTRLQIAAERQYQSLDMAFEKGASQT